MKFKIKIKDKIKYKIGIGTEFRSGNDLESTKTIVAIETDSNKENRVLISNTGSGWTAGFILERILDGTYTYLKPATGEYEKECVNNINNKI